MAAIDVNGRLADGTVIPSLNWAVNTRLDIRVRGDLVVVTADAHAVFRVTRAGQVRLPATVRPRSTRCLDERDRAERLAQVPAPSTAFTASGTRLRPSSVGKRGQAGCAASRPSSNGGLTTGEPMPYG